MNSRMYSLLCYVFVLSTFASTTGSLEGNYKLLSIGNSGKNYENQHDIYITKKKGEYFIRALGINERNTHVISIDNEKLTEVNENKYKIKQCNLKIEIVEKGSITVKHDFACGGVGTSLQGKWIKENDFRGEEN